ncbi:MAG: hypothetical protein GXP08_18180 [Gammaproteobacteria bacterium]|nr:hypothetical protein [Gammaproteobacteria bacterium]
MKKTLAAVTSLFFVALYAFSYWVATTENGLSWLLARIQNNIKGELTVKNPSGDLISTTRFSQIHYVDDNIDLSAANVKIHFKLSSLISKTIHFTTLEASDISIKLSAQDNDKTQATETFELNLPIALKIDKGYFTTFVFDAPPTPSLQLANISWQQLTLKTKLTLNRLHLENEYGTIITSGSIGLNAQQNIKLKTNWRLKPLNRIAEAQGSMLINGHLNNPKIYLESYFPFKSTLLAEVENLLINPHWQASFQSHDIKLDEIHPSLRTHAKEINFKSSGTLTAFNLVGSGTLTDKTLDSWQFDIDAQSNQKNTVINMLRLYAKASPAQLNASATFSSPISHISRNTSFTLKTHWNALQWPVDGDAKTLSQQGEMDISGILDNYSLSLSADIAVASQPFQNLVLSGTGNLQELALTQLGGEYINGTWLGNATINWSDAITWQANLTGENIDLSVLNKKYPSRLNSHINFTGMYHQNTLQTHSKIASLEGMFLGYPVQGKGEVVYADNQLQLRDVALNSKDTKFTASLSLDELGNETNTRIQAKWAISTNGLDQLTPHLKGNLQGQGTIQGLLQSPLIKAKVVGKKVNYKDKFSATTLNANINIDMTGKQTSHVNANGKQLQWGNSRIDQVNITGAGKPNKHRLKLALSGSEDLQFNTMANGEWKHQQWLLSLDKAKLHSRLFGQWEQQKTTPLQLSHKRLALSDYCFKNTNTKTSRKTTAKPKNTEERVCLTIQSDFQQWQGSLRGNNLSLSHIVPLLPPQIKQISGAISGKSHFTYQPNHPLQIRSLWHSDSGEFEYTIENGITQKSRFSNLQTNVTSKGEGLTLNSSLQIDNAGTMTLEATLPKALTLQIPLSEQPLSSQLTINLTSLDIISLLIPEVRATEGSWVSGISIEGTLASPIVAGNSRLVASNVSLPRWGVYLNSLETNTYSTKNSPMHIEGRATSKSGFVTFSGEVIHPNNSSMLSRLKIEGNEFTAVNLPEAHIEITPKLQIIMDDGNIQMEGELLINRADLQIFSNQSSISPSTDIIIIDNDSLVEKTGAPLFELTANVKIRFGDQVRLHGYGFDGKLKGDLVIIEKPNDLTRATGELQIIDGKYKAFSQELTITHGKLLYASTAVDNPTVNIRATRTTSNNVIAGVIVSGEAQAPKIDLFSEPAMDDADVLAYIVFGYPIKQASTADGAILSRAASSIGLAGGEKLAKDIADNFGIDEVRIESSNTTQAASLVLGKYLSPKLYIQYAIGIGQTVDAMQFQYQITDKWLIKGESAETQGADILYTIEK